MVVSSVSCRRVVKSDMRGLVTARTELSSRSWAAGLEIERDPLGDNVIVHRADAGHSKTLADTTIGLIRTFVWALVVEDGQRPAPASQLAGDRSVGDHRTFLAGIKASPAGVQAVIGGMPASPGHRGSSIPAAPQITAGPIRGAVMPGGLDQQPAGMGIAGLGHSTLGAGGPRGGLGGHQPQVGADRAARSTGSSRRSPRPIRTRSVSRFRADIPVGVPPG